jgi:hypothetical protein
MATGNPLTQHGWGVAATLLGDGQVLVAGLYDPAKGTFTSTGNMTVPRAEARAVRLRTGDVLFVGGIAITKDNPVLTAELYHPSSGMLSSDSRPYVRRTFLARRPCATGTATESNQGPSFQPPTFERIKNSRPLQDEAAFNPI